MPDPQTEIHGAPETKTAVERIAHSVYRTLAHEHELNSPPDLDISLFLGFPEVKFAEILGQLGAEVEGGLQTACTITINKDPYEQLIWIDINDPNISPLKNYTEYGFQKHKVGYSIIAEEISHFLYKDNYFKNHGEEPPEWMVEMIGALDKYNLFQRISIARNRRPMDTDEEVETDKLIFTGVNIQNAPADHAKGHREAKKIIGKLNKLSNAGKSDEAEKLFKTFYESTEVNLQEILR